MCVRVSVGVCKVGKIRKVGIGTILELSCASSKNPILSGVVRILTWYGSIPNCPCAK